MILSARLAAATAPALSSALGTSLYILGRCGESRITKNENFEATTPFERLIFSRHTMLSRAHVIVILVVLALWHMPPARLPPRRSRVEPRRSRVEPRRSRVERFSAYESAPPAPTETEWTFTRDVYDAAARLPGAEVLSDARPRLVLLRGFLAPEEVSYLVDSSRDRLSPSEVVTADGDGKSASRTSSGAWATRSPALERIEDRIHRVVGVPTSFGEGVYVLKYDAQQKYDAHNDHCLDKAGPPDAGCAGLLRQAGGPACGPGAGGPTCGDRLATFIMYLKSPSAGGRTVFPESAHTRRKVPAKDRKSAAGAPAEWYCTHDEVLGAAPQPGDALLFWNYEPSGDDSGARSVYAAMHSGCPVLAGEKWIATRWIRSAPVRP